FLRLKTIDAKKTVLIHSRFYVTLYSTFYSTDKHSNDERIRRLKQSFALADDEFFREHAPGYDWNYHRFRCLEHLGQLTENGNHWKLTPQQCSTVMKSTDLLDKLWHQNEKENDNILPRVQLDLITARNNYYGGRTQIGDYRSELLSLYTRYSNSRYDMYSVLANIFIPTEYMATLEGGEVDEEKQEVLRGFYRQITNYILHSDNRDAFCYMLEYLSSFLDRFIEIPGEETFEKMGLSCMAALHPPTYVHSMQVAILSRCLCEHLLRIAPEEFIGVCGCKTAEDVQAKKERILSRVFHGGLCHDFGKICMIDTIFVYGRRLLDTEYMIIRTHPDMGAAQLSRYLSTRDYVDIARGHHRWFNGTKGYPSSFDINESPDRILIHIVTVADSLDAATDQIGRSYKIGKSVNRLISELKKGSGKRYSPTIVSLFEHPEVMHDIEFLLKKGREDNYRNTYLLLRRMQANAIQNFNTRLKELVLSIDRVRKLSVPSITEMEDASEYAVLLNQHFREIGALAAENRQMLEKTLYPLLKSRRQLDQEEVDALEVFYDQLMHASEYIDLDMSLLYLVSRKLFSDAVSKGDSSGIIRQGDRHIMSCYTQLNRSKRLRYVAEITLRYRKEGLSIARELELFLDHERFLTLSMRDRETVLLNARYATALYENTHPDPKSNSKFMRKLKEALHLASDPFYTENAPDFDWNYHKLRCLEYFGQATECGNLQGFDEKQRKEIAAYNEQLEALWNENPPQNSVFLSPERKEMIVSRGKYYSGQLDVASYRKILLDLYEKNSDYRFTVDAVFTNILLPYEYLLTYRDRELTEEDGRQLQWLYDQLLDYMYHLPGDGVYSPVMEYFSGILMDYIEVPQAMSFEEMGLRCMALLHPPTYVHSMMVGSLSRCLCEHLLKRNPGLFMGVQECKTVEEVKLYKKKIVDFCYHAACCHDFGKLPMIDMISIYGRKILDIEFSMLKHHTTLGAEMLKRHESTRDYAPIAIGHHRWYDGSKGYPEGYDVAHLQEKVIIDIVTVADCLDAATDTVGRSYSTGKKPDEIFLEIQEGAGTRYSPMIASMFADFRVREDLTHILN
ncbi:MAG: HD domain-containing protein, partial [Lachnospiraceae bacterium]|nr:HD domain-containing protein [Lachnospiraceae bacterium]